MSKPKARALHTVDNGGEKAYLLLPHALIKSEAYKTASFRARSALIAIASGFNGYNNGRICLSSKQLAEALGCANYSANAQAIGELIARGIVVLERSYPSGARMSPEYRLTFISSGQEGQVRQATNDYRHWRTGDAGTRRKRAIGNSTLAIIATETPSSAATIATVRKPSVATIATENGANDGNPPVFQQASVATIAEHIGSHRGALANPSKNTVETTGGPSEVDLRALRDRVNAHIASTPGATQKQVAEEAGIQGGTFSKFLHRGRGLPRGQFIGLQLALCRLSARAAA